MEDHSDGNAGLKEHAAAFRSEAEYSRDCAGKMEGIGVIAYVLVSLGFTFVHYLTAPRFEWSLVLSWFAGNFAVCLFALVVYMIRGMTMERPRFATIQIPVPTKNRVASLRIPAGVEVTLEVIEDITNKLRDPDNKWISLPSDIQLHMREVSP